MQTFLPDPRYNESARILDRSRLGKQRVECKQILIARVMGPGIAWYNHPATRMWAGHEYSLCKYAIEMCHEWRRRGYKDNMLQWFERHKATLKDKCTAPPPWIGWKEFHDSHKSNLLRKFPIWYSRYGWDVPDDLPYIWPCNSI